VAVLTARQESLSDDGLSGLASYNGGMQWAFGLSAILSLGVIVLAVLLPNRLPESEQNPPVGHIADDESDETVPDALID